MSRSAQDYKVVFFPLNGIEARDDFAVAHVASVYGSGWARGPSRADYNYAATQPRRAANAGFP